MLMEKSGLLSNLKLKNGTDVNYPWATKYVACRSLYGFRIGVSRVRTE